MCHSLCTLMGARVLASDWMTWAEGGRIAPGVILHTPKLLHSHMLVSR